MRKEEELQRLMRLRNQQIRTRDPQARARKLHGRISEQQRRRRKRFNLTAIWQELGQVKKRWIGAFIGGALGFAAMIILSVTIGSGVALVVGVVAMGVLGFVGFLFGMAFDWRNEISDLGKG